MTWHNILHTIPLKLRYSDLYYHTSLELNKDRQISLFVDAVVESLLPLMKG